MRNISYQINRPRDSRLGIQKLRINRLSRWTVASRQGFLLSAALSDPTRTTMQISQRLLAVRLELDINTVLGFEGELSFDLLPKLFDELVELGTQIAQEGDVP